MDDITKGVKEEQVPPTSSEAQDVKEEIQGTSPDAVETTQDTQSPAVGQQPEVDKEVGVPWANRRMEIRQDILKEVSPTLNALQEELRQLRESRNSQASTPSSPKYTLTDLDWIEENHPEHANWAKQERLKLIKAEAVQEALSQFKNETAKERAVREQQEAIQTVVTRHPELIDKATGQWNTASPLYQRAMQVYGSDPSYRNHPRGLEAAVRVAYGDLAYEQRGTMQKQIVKQTAKERQTQKLQSQALGAGGQAGADAPPPQTNEKLIAEFARTRDPRIMAQILRSKGVPVPTS